VSITTAARATAPISSSPSMTMSTRTARWLFQVCRKPDKTFPQRKPDGIGRGWIWKTGDVRKVLYRLPRSSRQLAAKTHPKIARHRHVAAHHACELRHHCRRETNCQTWPHSTAVNIGVKASEPAMSAPLRRLMKDPNVITDLLSVADSGLRRRFERTQRSSSAGSIGRQKSRWVIPTEECWLIAGLFVV
jgi:hypothetical protein